jgi:hypothetical protein
MLPFLLNIRTTLDGIHPGLFNAALALILFGAMYLFRKVRPDLFAKLPTKLQAWPALALGAVVAALSASTGAGALDAVLNALGMSLTGLLSGTLAVGTNRVLKESPLPYGTPPPKNGKPPSGPAAVAIIMGLMLFGCGIPAKTVVSDACREIDSGNPQIGVLCLTAEEIASLFGHVKASRAYRASHAGAAPDRKIDICKGEEP